MSRALAALLLCWSLCTAPARAEQVTVFAAASLQDGLAAVLPAWEAQSGHEVRLSLAGSSALARQISAGAPVDLFISANVDWMDHLAGTGDVLADTRVDLLRNRLVLAGPVGAAPLDLTQPDAIADRLGRRGRLAMALVEAVPAGIYGREALVSLGAWDALSSRVAQTDSVRAALALVARGAVPLGVVYATDVGASPRVAVLAEFPADSHAPILYPAALTPRGDRPAAQALLAYLAGPQAQAGFAAQGFLPGAAP